MENTDQADLKEEELTDEQRELQELAGVYWDLVKYPSIQIYLKRAIGARNTKISKNVTLAEKIEAKEISNYLRGVKLFFEFSDQFDTPEDFITYYESIRDNKGNLFDLRDHIEDYTAWLFDQYSQSTSTTYQAQFRGYLKWNFITMKFTNYDEPSEKRKTRNTLGIDYHTLVEIVMRVKMYLSKRTEFEIYLVTNWLHISGLGSRELLTLQFKDLRPKLDDFKELEDLQGNYIRLSGQRQKTNIEFRTFIYGEVLEDVWLHLQRNKDKSGEEYLFGDPDRAYDRLWYKFSLVVDHIIETYYPKWVKDHKEQSLFTMHDYRHIFVTAYKRALVPEFIGKSFVAHKSSGAYDEPIDLLQYFKQTQKYLFTNLYPQP